MLCYVMARVTQRRGGEGGGIAHKGSEEDGELPGRGQARRSAGAGHDRPARGRGAGMEPLGRRAGRDPTFMIACEVSRL